MGFGFDVYLVKILWQRLSTNSSQDPFLIAWKLRGTFSINPGFGL